jgi:hypothetical protein
MHRPTPIPAALGLALLALIAAPGPRLAAQSDAASPITSYFAHWYDRVDAAQASQPSWITPLATVTPRLEEEFRYDQNRQTLANGGTVDIYGAGKGLELIPTGETEVIITMPPYQVRRDVGPASGLNDWPGILLKYRLLSANAKSGDYIVTVFAQYGIPTGALVYTNHNHVFTPTLAAGKGFGDFDVQATLGEAIPTHDNSKAGRMLLGNLTAQYHLAKVFWPELELNGTGWHGGSRDGRSQAYLTAGLVLGRFPIGGRSKMIVGAGYQAPLSEKYAKAPATPTFNHNWILSARVTF